MSYESAKATKLIATHCAFCGKPLVDAISVEVGMGPVCRKKYWPTDLILPHLQQEANKLIHFIALEQAPTPEVRDAILRLKELGFEKVATRLRRRLRLNKKVIIEIKNNRIYLKTAGVGKNVFPIYLERLKQIPGRRWESEEKINSFPTNQKRAVLTLLKDVFPGCPATGPKGDFII